MCKELLDTVKQLNADVSNVANCEKAKKLRSKLMKIGLPMTICGFVGVFVCFIAFALIGVSTVNSMSTGFPIAILIPFFLIIPCAVVGGTGATLVKIALSIIITGYATKLIDDTVGNNCPNCGDTIQPGELYCSKCGTPLTITCPNCNHVNDPKNNYCENCGTKLK